MGGKSSSSSSSSNASTTENYDQRVAVERDGVGIGANAVVDVTLTDFGVVEGAASILEKGLEFSQNAISGVTEAFSEIVGQALADNATANESDSKELAVLVVKIGAVMVAIVSILAIVLGQKK